MIAPIFFIILYIFVPECASADSTEPNNNKGECKIKNFSDSDWKVFKKLDLNDNDAEKTIFTAEYSDELEVEQCVLATGPQIRDYFTFEVKDKLFQIETTAKLKELDEIIPRQTEDYVNAYISCSLKCPKGETVVKFRFDIKDINEHAPTFGESEYTYSVPTPLMPESDLTRYGKSVIVEDLDFSNNNITFSIDPDDFEINAVPVENSKKYVAEFAAKKVLFLKEPKEYTLTATDDGKDPGPLSNKVKVKVTVDSDTSIDTPSFSTPSYTFEYQVTDGKPTLIPKSGPITIDSSKFNELEITVSGDLKDQIKATLNKDKKEIEISIETPITTLASFVAFTIDVKTDLTTSALVVIHMPEITLEFDTHLITGDYDPTTKQLNMHQKVTLKSTEEAKVSLSGDESDYLSLVTDKSSNSYSIAIKEGKSIPEEDLKGKKSLSLTITATLGEKTDKASVLIYLPANNLKFTNTLYTASYDAKKKTVTVEKNPITFSNKVDAVTITVDDTYKDFFQIIYDTKDQKGEVKVVKELTTEILSAGKPLILEITATDSDKNEAKAVLEITIPKINGPEFKKAYYEVTYPKDGKSPISVDFDFETETDPSKVEIKLEDAEYEKNFKIEYLNKKWQITILSPLSIDTLEKIRDLKILIVATEAGITLSGHSVLIISLPEIKGPQFTESVYIVEYPKDGKGPIKFQKNLNFEDGVVVDSIDISDYKDNFSIDKEDDLWEIKIKTGLDLEKLKDQTELILTMTAKEKDNTETGTASLIIKLPHSKNDGPRFKEAYYTLTYPKDAKDGSTLDFSQIAFENVADESKLTISLGGYQDNFKIELDKTTKKWIFTITKALDEKVLNEQTEIPIEMIAEETGKSTKGFSALLLDLPTKSADKTLLFEKQFYIAKYPKSADDKTVLSFDTDIKFKNFAETAKAKITLKVSENSENFNLNYDDKNKKWVLTIKKPLDSSVIKNKNQLVFVLEAAAESLDTGTATLIIEIEKDLGNGPRFKKALYEAQYPKTGTGNIDLSSIDFNNVDDYSKIIITTDRYDEYFKIEQDATSKKWVMNILKSLDAKTLKENTEIIITMTAKETGKTSETSAVLVLKLPNNSNKKSLNFKEQFYVAKYPKSAIKQINFDKDIEFSNLAELTKAQITLDGELKEYFDVKYDESTKKFVLNIQKPLDDDTLKRKTEIILILKATSDDFDAGNAILVIEIEKDDTTAPKFKKALYQAQYPKSGAGKIELEEIDFENVDDATKISIVIDSYVDNFKIELDESSKKWRMNILKELDAKTLKENTELLITMTAKIIGKTSETSSVLVLKLPSKTNKESLNFKEQFYVAKYPKSAVKQVNFDKDIGFSNLAELKKAQITLDGEFKEFFTVTYDEATKKFVLNFQKPLDEDTLKRKTELILILKATSIDFDAGNAILVVEIEKDSTTAPKFKKALYQANYPKTGAGQIDLGDIDFDNVNEATKINIGIDSYQENFNIVQDEKSKKWQIIILKALDTKILSDNTELFITMTVEGTTNSAVLVLKLPDKSGKDSLTFKDLFYVVKYSKAAKELNFDKEITFSKISDNNKVKISLNDLSDYFQVNYNDKKKQWVVNIVKPLNDDVIKKTNELVLIMTAKADDFDAGIATLVIELEKDSNTGPAFKKVLYNAQYPKSGSEAIDVDLDFINVADTTKISIKIDSYQDYFKIVKDETSKKWRINILKELDTKILTDNTELFITMTLEGTTNSAVLVLKLPSKFGKESLTFKDLFYVVKYPKAGAVKELNFDKDIKFTKLADNIKVKISINDLKDYFQVNYDDKKKQWVLNIQKPLNDDVIKKNNELVLIMTAQADDFEAGIATLVIELEKDITSGPTFKKAHYEVDYPKSGTGTIDTDIDFENVKDVSKLKIITDSYKENFDVTRDETTMKWEIRITKALDPKILEEKTELLITMTIEEDGKTTNAAAVLVLKLPDEKTITFKNQFYIAAYPKSGTGKIQFDKAIEFSNLENSKEVSITVKDYAENFELSYDDAAKKWVLNVKKPLEKTIINAKNELVIVLEAAFTGFKAGTATLVVEIEKEISTSPKFSKSLYEADYPTNGKDNIALDSLDFENVEDKSKVVVSVPGYETNFKFVLDPKTSKWHIEIVEPLKNENLQEKTDLRLILLATEEGLKTESALILNLPSKSGEKAPKFKNDYYTADYPKTAKVDDEIIIQKALEFSNVAELEKVAIQLEDHSDNFEIYYNAEKKWVLKIKKILDNEESSKELVTTIYATQTDEKGTGKAVLVVKLPSAETEEGPEFSETSYTGEYKKENDKYVVDLKKKIVVTSTKSTDKILVTMLQTERNFNVNKYFSLEKGSDSYTIKVKENLSDLLLSRKYLTITIQAELDDKKSTALLIINLPTQDTTGLAKFDKVLYKGQYSENKFVYDSMQVITELEDEKVQVKLEDDSYNDIFKVSYAHKIVKIEILKPLPSENKISLVLDILVGEKVQSSAVLEITNSGEQNSIQFDKLVYNGEYNLKEETLKVEKITLRTSLAEDKIKVSISDYKDYFTAQLKDSVLTITLTKALPATILKDKHFLSLTIDVTAEGLTETVSATLNIDLIDPNVDTVVNFDKSIYNAQLNLTEDNKEFSYEPIDLTVSPSSGQVTVAVAEAYQAIFDVKLDNQKVKISLKSTADVSKLHNLTNIAVELRASVPGTKASTFAVLNVEILGETGTNATNIMFSKLVYQGAYRVQKGIPRVDVKDQIEIITNRLDEDLILEVVGGRREFFNITLANKKISIAVAKKIPRFMIKNSVITLVLHVSGAGTNSFASAVLNIRIGDHPPLPPGPGDFNKTPYIVAISLLSVSLIVLTAGAIAFYYFKIRRKDYTEVDEEIWKVRFDKSSMSRPSDGRKGSALEGRRPTGFVFNPPQEDEENPRESTTDGPERRKSVLFDNKVEKREIDSALDEEDEKEKKNGIN